jgi:hypothetical protein
VWPPNAVVALAGDSDSAGGTLPRKCLFIYFIEADHPGWGGRASGAPLSLDYIHALILDHMCSMVYRNEMHLFGHSPKG